MFCFHPMIIAISTIAVMGKCFIDRSINAIKKCFKRNDSFLKNAFRCLVLRNCLYEQQRFGKAYLFEQSLYGCFEYETYIYSPQSLCLFSIFTILHHWYVYAFFVFSTFMAIEKSTALEEGDIALELTEQKINMMVLDICHKPGGSEYLRQIYHIMRLNEVGKRPFYRAIRCVLAWGSVCWQLRVSQEGDNTS